MLMQKCMRARARLAGEKLSEIVGNMTAVAEGVLTSRSAHALAQRLGVEAPIIEGIFRVIHEGADPVAVVTEVMRRGPKGPSWGRFKGISASSAMAPTL
jgi:glycerol-3-phosphate dehydrogenase